MLNSFFGRNALGVLALMIAFFIPDRFSIELRTGFAKYSPYLLLLLMYGWIVFHNRILFDRLFLTGKRPSYFMWTIGLMAVSSVNMHLVITKAFHETDSLSKIIGFWVFSITGFGMYVFFKYLAVIQRKLPVPSPRQDGSAEFFSCTVDGRENQIPFAAILYFESLENYVRVVTQQKKYLVRLPLKEVELKLPKSFLRISRSHIVNVGFVEHVEADRLKIQGQILKIGKVYKRYVEVELTGAGRLTTSPSHQLHQNQPF